MSLIPRQSPCSPDKPREPTFPAAPTKSPFNKPKPHASACPNFPPPPPRGTRPPPSLCGLALSHRSILQETRSEERVNARLIADPNEKVHCNTQATEQLTKSITNLTTLVKSLNAKIHLNNRHIEALQDQFKLAFSALGHICELVRSVDHCFDNVSDKIRYFRDTFNTLTANLPYIVATQVHRGIRLSQTNETLPQDCRWYCHLSPNQDFLIHELYHGNLNPLLTDDLDSNSQHN